jgi:hypothetical protein
MFRTTDKRLFEFLIGRGHHNWRVRLEGGTYVARFRDTERLRRDVSEFNNGRPMKVGLQVRRGPRVALRRSLATNTGRDPGLTRGQTLKGRAFFRRINAKSR